MKVISNKEIHIVKPVKVNVKKMTLKEKLVEVKLKKHKIKVKKVRVNLKPIDLGKYLKNSENVASHTKLFDVYRKNKRITAAAVSHNNNIVSVLNDLKIQKIVDCLAKGKVTRLPSCNNIIPMSSYVNYELGSQKSIEEDDEDSPTKEVPAWAHRRSVLKALLSMDVDPDIIFEACDPPDLSDMFPCNLTLSFERDILNSPTHSNIIDTTYVLNDDQREVDTTFVVENMQTQDSDSGETSVFVIKEHKEINNTSVTADELTDGDLSTVTVTESEKEGSKALSDDDNEISFDFTLGNVKPRKSSWN